METDPPYADAVHYHKLTEFPLSWIEKNISTVFSKWSHHEEVFRDELPSLIQDEVCAQLDEILALDDKELPNFGDTDYQLAAYAAALRVMTQFSSIEGINIGNELCREKQRC